MGCDGGTIPRRDELVRLKKKKEVKDKDSELAFQWRYCYLSQQPLQNPIVMCSLGHLYNKEAVIEELLSARKSDVIRHIKSLKDIKNVLFTSNPVYENSDRKDGTVDQRASPYICPVIGIEVTGTHRFVAPWSCGCVFSERALKEINTKVCHKCQKPFINEDIIILNGNEDDLIVLKANMEARKQKSKKDKKIKTETKDNVEVKNEPGTSGDKPTESTDSKLVVNVAATSSKIASRVVNGSLPLKRPSDEALSERIKKMKKDYSIAKDPKASDVYKSLFTSHESEKQQDRAHWITYNPFYN